MRHFDNAHSRAVAWAKIVLPLVALVLLSVLFLFSGKADLSDPLPYADVDLDALAREQRLGAPEFSGITANGSALTITASEARNDAKGAPIAYSLSATLKSPSGFTANLTSDAGQIDGARGEIQLTGAVSVQTSSGYTLTTQALTGRLDDGALMAPSEIQGTAPFGTLTAGAMALRPEGEDSETAPYVLRFTNGVKLIYTPAK